MTTTSRKTPKYIEENMHVNPTRMFWNAIRKLDFKQPIVIVGRDSNSDLFVSSTDSGQLANSILAKAMNFIKNG